MTRALEGQSLTQNQTAWAKCVLHIMDAVTSFTREQVKKTPLTWEQIRALFVEQNALVQTPKRVNNIRSAQQHHDSAPLRAGNANQINEWTKRMSASSKQLRESERDDPSNDSDICGKCHTLGIKSYHGGNLRHPTNKCNNSDIFDAVSKKHFKGNLKPSTSKQMYKHDNLSARGLRDKYGITITKKDRDTNLRGKGKRKPDRIDKLSAQDRKKLNKLVKQMDTADASLDEVTSSLAECVANSDEDADGNSVESN